jgi:hypothetical protein
MKDGKPVSGPNIGSARGFSAQLWLTEHEGFFQEFAQGGNVKSTAPPMRRDVPVFLTFFITGPGLTLREQQCDGRYHHPSLMSNVFRKEDAPC